MKDIKEYTQKNRNPNGEIDILFRRNSSGKTIMAKQYSKVPLQVLKPHYYDVDGTAFVYSLNPSGGILQHDYLRTRICCEEGSSAVFTSPGNTKFYRMDEGCARVENIIEVRDGAVLEYLPEHNVPFAESVVFQENEIHLEKGAKLIASDMVTSGRAAKGERFKYTSYQSRTRVYLDGELVLYDNCAMVPQEEDLMELGLLDGKMTNGTMYVYCQDMDRTLKDKVSELGDEKVVLGAGNIGDDLLVVRFIGDEIIHLSEMVQKVWDVCRKSILGKPAVHLRKEFSPGR